MHVFLMIAGVLAFIGIIVAVGIWMDRKRRDALQAVAEEMGLPFYPDGYDGALAGVDHLKLFNTGRARKLTKAFVVESDETALCIFDYKYTVGHGKHSKTHSQTIASVQSGKLNMPEFAMKNEGLFSKLGAMVGMQDIDFETHPQFSKMFLLTGPSEQAVRFLFRPELLEYFETRKGISVEGNSGAFVYYTPGRTVKPDDIKQFMTTAYEIYAHLVDSIEGQPSQPPTNPNA